MRPLAFAALLTAITAAPATASAAPDTLAAGRWDSTAIGLTLRTDAPDALGLPDPDVLADIGFSGRERADIGLARFGRAEMGRSTPAPPAALPRPVVFLAVSAADASAMRSPDADSLVLPARMPPYTRLLWGRRGLVRALGLAPSTRRKEIQLRRTMLAWHQRGGLATWVPLTVQWAMGERMAADATKRAEWGDFHRTLGYTTFGMYMGTASLSLGAPPGRRYTGRFSSTQLHKYLAVVHFAGMAATPFLGRWVANGSGDAYERRLNTHKWVSRVTYSAYTAALATMYLGR